MTRLQDITEAGLEAALAAAAGTATVVEFYGARCPACQVVAGILEEIACEAAPAVRFAKLDVDARPDVAERIGIRGVPLLVVFEGEREARRMAPARPSRAAIRAFVEGTA